MAKSEKTVEQRLQELEEFQNRVKLGQKWAICLLAGIGSVVAFISYVLSSINQVEVWRHTH